MKLYAIEHHDGGRWWDVIESVWADELSPLSLVSEDVAKGWQCIVGGTVVTFHLTREPELRVGARVVIRGGDIRVWELVSEYIVQRPTNPPVNDRWWTLRIPGSCSVRNPLGVRTTAKADDLIVLHEMGLADQAPAGVDAVPSPPSGFFCILHEPEETDDA